MRDGETQGEGHVAMVAESGQGCLQPGTPLRIESTPEAGRSKEGFFPGPSEEAWPC